MFSTLRSLFKELINENHSSDIVDTETLQLSMASLLCEVVKVNDRYDPREKTVKIHQLSKLLDISQEQAIELLDKAKERIQSSVSLYEFTNKLRILDQSQRYQLIEAMWQVAFADGVIDPLEDAVIRQVSDLIYLDHTDFIKAKLNAQKKINE